MRYGLLLASLPVLILVACTDSAPPFSVESLTVPAGVPATGPRVSGDAANGFMLSWMESGDDGDRLHYSRFDDGRWSTARTVVDGRDMFVNWADMPMVKPMGDGHLVAHWLEMSGESTYAYDVVFVQSFDDGETWTEPLRPHDDGTQTEHGFVSMFPYGDRTGLIWLDGRKFDNERTDNPVDTSMTLRGALIDRNNTLDSEQLIDDIICDCCQTDVALAASGPVAVYRDRTVDEIRDISVTRFVHGSWVAPATVASDGWEFPACPVNGPAIVADGSFVAVAWFTGAGDQPAVKLAMSQDDGQSFSAPIEVATGHVQGRVGLVKLGDDAVAVSWLQSSDEDGFAIVVRRYDAAGNTGPLQIVSNGAGGSAVPQIALIGAQLVFVWTETENFVNSIRSARVAVRAL